MASCSVTMAAVAGLSGRKIAAKNWSCTPAQSKGPRKVLSLLTFLGAIRSTLPPAMYSILAEAYSGPVVWSPKPRPHGIGLQRPAILRHFGLDRDHVAVTKLKRLTNA